jgi:hypothetical protein
VVPCLLGLTGRIGVTDCVINHNHTVVVSAVVHIRKIPGEIICRNSSSTAAYNGLAESWKGWKKSGKKGQA